MLGEPLCELCYDYRGAVAFNWFAPELWRRFTIDVRRALAGIRAFCPQPLPITAATHEAALGIAERLGYQVYDSLIIASALEAGCATLYSEDMQDGQVVEGRLTIRNPFTP